MGNGVLRSVKSAAHGRLIRVGIDIRRLRPDRKVLERVIFPFLLEAPSCRRILFVGCAWYTQHYPWIFGSREFWTLECDATQARFGSPRHIVDRCERVATHFPPDSLDAVICNGVYGYGLNDETSLRCTIDGFRAVLRTRGLLVFGWNNVPPNDPLGMGREDFRTKIFNGFTPMRSPPLGESHHEIPCRNRHTYEFLERA